MSDLTLFLQDMFCVSDTAKIQDLSELFDLASCRLVYRALLTHPRLLNVLYIAHVFRTVFGYSPSPAIVETILDSPHTSLKSFIADHTIFSCIGSADRITALQGQLNSHISFLAACSKPDFVLAQAWLWVKRGCGSAAATDRASPESTTLFKYFKDCVSSQRLSHPDDGAHHAFTGNTISRASEICAGNKCWYAADALHHHLLLNKHFFISIMTRKSVIIDPGVDDDIVLKILPALSIVSKCKWNIFATADVVQLLKNSRIQQFIYAFPELRNNNNVPQLFPKGFIGEHIIITKNTTTYEPYSHIHNTTDKHIVIYTESVSVPTSRSATNWCCVSQHDEFKKVLSTCTNASQCPFVIPTYDGVNPATIQVLLDLYMRPLHTVPPAQIFVYLAAACSLCENSTPTPGIVEKNDKAVLVVDNRPNPMSVFAALVTLHNLENPAAWDVVVFTSTPAQNYYKSYLPACAKVVPLDVLDEAQFDVATYNEYLKTPNFWNCLAACGYKKVLMVQDDGFIVRPGVEEFLEFDYVGAPWVTCPANQELSVLTNMVGNGGCSLRSVDAMLQIARDYPKDNEPLFNNNVQPIQEDVYFAAHCHTDSRWKIADKDVANEFSSEQILSKKSIAFHKIWAYHSPPHILDFSKSFASQKDEEWN